MKKSFALLLGLFTILMCQFNSVEAIRKKAFFTQQESDCFLAKHYNLGYNYYSKENWRSAAHSFELVVFFFPDSEQAAEVSYYLAVCYFEMKEYDFANEEFSSYLNTSDHPEHFESAVYYKYCIAEYFKKGHKKRPFKLRYIPKVACGQELALTIFDEVIAAMPNNQLTVCALNSKAELLRKMREYRLAVDAYQAIIRRFPKNEFVPECYLNIAHAYVEQSRYEFQNPDIIALAELNARKFAEDFPRDERVLIVEASVRRINEHYAKGLYDLGRFYERMKQPKAALIYYKSAVEEFPQTCVAKLCEERILILEEEQRLQAELVCCVECEPECESVLDEPEDFCSEMN